MRQIFLTVAALGFASALQAGEDPLTKLDTLLQEGKFADAKAQAKDALDLRVKDNGAAAIETLEAALRLGQAELWLGKVKDAETVLADGLKKARASLGEKHDLTARLQNDLGVALYQQARYREAAELLKEALAIRQKGEATTLADLALALRNLAWCEQALGNHAAGQALFAKARDALKENMQQKEPGLTRGAEAVVFLDAKPIYPRIELFLEYRLPTSKPPVIKGPAKPGTFQTVERIGVLDFALGENMSFYSQPAKGLGERLFGKDDLRAVVARLHAEIFSRNGASADDVRALESVLGPQHPLLIPVRRNQALDAMNFNRINDAVAPLQAAVKSSFAAWGKKHPVTLDLFEATALLMLKAKQHDEAAKVLNLVVRERGEVLGDDHPATATARSVLAVALFHRGDYSQSRQLLEMALANRVEKWGLEHPDTASVRGDLGALLKHQGDYAGALRHLEQALAVLKKTAGVTDYRTRTVAENLCVVQMELGDFASATRYYEQVLKGDAPPFQKDKALVHLASIARAQGQLDLAAPMYEQAIKKTPEDPAIWNQLGAVYRDLGQLDKADKALTEALNLRKKRNGAGAHPETAFTLSSLGILRQRQAKHDEAIAYFEQALAMYENQQGKLSFNVADITRLLGITHLLMDDLPGAKRRLRQSLDMKLALARDVLPALAEAEALAFIANLDERDALLSAQRLSKNPDAEEAYAAVWTTRGLVTRALSARRHFVSQDSKLRALADRLHQTRQQLAVELGKRQASIKFFPLGEKEMKAFEEQLIALNDEKVKLERELAQLSEPFRRQELLSSGTPADLARKLPPDVAVIDLLKVKAWQRDAKTGKVSPQSGEVYEAFVLRRGEDKEQRIRWHSLGAASAIDDAVQEWRRVGIRPRKELGLKGEHPGQILRKLVWAPIAKELEGCKTAVLILDGDLAFIPFAALPGEKAGTFLLEDIALSTVSHGQHLLWLLDQQPISKGAALLVGGVAYDEAPEGSSTHAYRPVVAATRSGWAALPGTAKEVQSVAGLVPSKDARIFTGVKAAKDAVVGIAPECRYIHLATHGQFAAPAQRPVQPGVSPDRELLLDNPELYAGKLRTTPVYLSVLGRNPLVMSGLVFAGANQKEDGQVRGILSAEEVVDLDLGKTELVVLSACETGLGKTAGGEGVFGLQRAFGLAGARTVAASLWSVPDEPTRVLMEKFYENLWTKKMTKAEALRQAQLWMLREGQTDPGVQRGLQLDDEPVELLPQQRLPPYFWAAFVLAGDWR